MTATKSNIYCTAPIHPDFAQFVKRAAAAAGVSEDRLLGDALLQSPLGLAFQQNEAALVETARGLVRPALPKLQSVRAIKAGPSERVKENLELGARNVLFSAADVFSGLSCVVTGGNNHLAFHVLEGPEKTPLCQEALASLGKLLLARHHTCLETSKVRLYEARHYCWREYAELRKTGLVIHRSNFTSRPRMGLAETLITPASRPGEFTDQAA